MSEGNGPVDAIFKAIRMIIPHDDACSLFLSGSCRDRWNDAQAEVSVKIEENGKTVVGQGTDADTLVASARAYIHAVNKLIDKRERNRTARGCCE